MRWLWTLKNTVDQHQQMTRQPKSSLKTSHFKQHGSCASPLFLQTLGPWFPNEMQNLLSSEKRTLNHWATVQLFFFLSPCKMLLMLFMFQKWLGSPFPEDVWAWWLQFQFTPCEALPSGCSFEVFYFTCNESKIYYNFHFDVRSAAWAFALPFATKLHRLSSERAPPCAKQTELNEMGAQ